MNLLVKFSLWLSLNLIFGLGAKSLFANTSLSRLAIESREEANEPAVTYDAERFAIDAFIFRRDPMVRSTNLSKHGWDGLVNLVVLPIKNSPSSTYIEDQKTLKFLSNSHSYFTLLDLSLIHI